MYAKTHAVHAVVFDLCVGLMMFAAMSVLAWQLATRVVRWDFVRPGIMAAESLTAASPIARARLNRGG
jgi:hypothetical protein